MTRWGVISAVCLGAVVVAGMAAAQNNQGGQSRAPGSNLVCSTGGIQYGVGEYACIPVCHGARRLARCDIIATAFSGQAGQWTYVSDACPSVMIIKPPWPNDWTQVPPAVAMSPLPVTVNLSAISPEIAPRVGSHWN